MKWLRSTAPLVPALVLFVGSTESRAQEHQAARAHEHQEEGVEAQASGRSSEDRPAAAEQPARDPGEPSGFRAWIERRLSAAEGTGAGPSRGFFPVFATVVSGSGVAGGAGYRDHALFGSSLGFDVSGMVSTRGYQLYRARIGRLSTRRQTVELKPADSAVGSMIEDADRRGTGFSAYVEGRYRYYPQQRFYGTGPRSRPEDRTDYLLEGGSYDVVVEVQPTETFGVSGRAGFLDTRIAAGRDERWPATQDRFTARDAPGLVQPPGYFVTGIGATLDTRESRHDPHDGLFLAGAAWRFLSTAQPRFDFTRLALDARAYFEPFDWPGVIAARAVVVHDIGGSGSVPFFLQQALGGGQLLWAWDTGRFRDRALAHASVEYRLSPHKYVEVAPFVDVGTVGPRLGGLRRDRVNVSLGVGLRGRWKDRVLGRVDLAWGREGGRVVFAAGPAF